MTRWSAVALALLALSALGQSARVALRWKVVAGASAYELQIAKDSTFIDVVLQTRTTAAGYRWEQLPQTTHWWRVRSVDAEGRVGEWSAPRTVAVDSVVPELVRPAEGGVAPCGSGVEVELAASNLIKEYQLELSSNPGFQGAQLLRSPTPVLALGPLAAGTWFVRALAMDLKGATVGPGPVRAFVVRVAAPKLKPVADSLLGAGQVSLAWSEVACAASYVVETSPVEPGSAREVSASAAPSSVLAFKSNAAGEYRWRVAGVDERGQTGEWSAEGVLRVKLPAPSALKNEAARGAFELSWASVPTATAYTVELLGADQEPLRETVSGTSWRTPVLAPGRSTWRVQAKDAKNHLSAFSDPRTLEHGVGAALGVPRFHEVEELVASGGEVELSWDDVPGAASYELEVDGHARPALAARVQRVSGVDDGQHLVRVRALGVGDRASVFSDPLALFWGVPPVVKAEVAVVGDEVQVVLRDERGRVVSAAPTLTVKQGQLGTPVERDGRWTARWRSAVDEDVLQVDQRAFHAEQAIRRSVPPRFWVAAHAGGLFNGGAVASPSGSLALGYRLPLFARRLGVEVRGSLAFASASLPVGTETTRGTAWLVPLSLLAVWQQPVGAYQLRGGVGPSVQVLVVSVDQTRQTSAVPGFEVAAAIARALGPGRVELEVGFAWARLDTSLARLIAGGVSAQLGYVVDFELGAPAPAKER